jgi:hypothetical protein
MKHESGDPTKSTRSLDTSQDDGFKSIEKKMGDELAEPYHDSRQRAYRGSSRRGRRLNYRALFGEDYSPSEEESESDSEAEEEGNYEKLSPTSKRKAHR